MIELSESQQDELRAQHGAGNMTAIEGPGEDEDSRQWFVIRKPTKPEWSRYKRDLKDDNKAQAAEVEIVCKLCVFPGPEEMRQICQDFPAFSTLVGLEVLKLAGFNEGAQTKKI